MCIGWQIPGPAQTFAPCGTYCLDVFIVQVPQNTSIQTIAIGIQPFLFNNRLTLRPKFYLARLDTTRHVRLCRASRAMLFQHGGRRTSCVGLVFACTSFVERVERDECVEPCLFQHGGRRRSSSACVY